MSAPAARLRGARHGVTVTFILNGLALSSWIARIPEVRDALDLSNGQLGAVLFVIAVGSLCSLPTTGRFIQQFGAAAVMRAGSVVTVAGLFVSSAAVDVAGSVWLTCAGLFFVGVGIGVWDVAMNVEAAAVERLLGRTIMPRFHAGFSLGTVGGALLGAAGAAAQVPLVVQLWVVGACCLAGAWWASFRFLSREIEESADVEPSGLHASVTPRSAWREPRTIMIGLMVCALGLAEGSANDWLAITLIDGYNARHWVAVSGFALFVTAMTAGRMFGPVLLDRWGRVPVVRTTILAAGIGILLIVFGGSAALATIGIVLWGLGASLGFPVGMSAAADEETRAPQRVGVVSTIAYSAFLAGPPLLGFVGDRVGSLDSLIVVAVLLLPALLLVPAARPVNGRRATPKR